MKSIYFDKVVLMLTTLNLIFLLVTRCAAAWSLVFSGFLLGYAVRFNIYRQYDHRRK